MLADSPEPGVFRDMSPFERMNPHRERPFRTPPRGTAWSSRLSAALPWIFVVGMVTATLLPVRQWMHGTGDSQAARDSEMIWKTAGNSSVRHPVDVLRTIDGDTFEARV